MKILYIVLCLFMIMSCTPCNEKGKVANISPDGYRVDPDGDIITDDGKRTSCRIRMVNGKEYFMCSTHGYILTPVVK